MADLEISKTRLLDVFRYYYGKTHERQREKFSCNIYTFPFIRINLRQKETKKKFITISQG